MKLFEKKYDGESMADIGRDVYEAFNKDFNPLVENIPQDVHGFPQGEFIVSIEWLHNTE